MAYCGRRGQTYCWKERKNWHFWSNSILNKPYWFFFNFIANTLCTFELPSKVSDLLIKSQSKFKTNRRRHFIRPNNNIIPFIYVYCMYAYTQLICMQRCFEVLMLLLLPSWRDLSSSRTITTSCGVVDSSQVLIFWVVGNVAYISIVDFDGGKILCVDTF